MNSVRIALGAGLVITALAIVLTLLRSPMSVARTNRLPGKPEETLASVRRSANYCQPGEVLPHGTSAIRVWLVADAGPRVRLDVYSQGRLVTSGERGTDWIGGSVTVPVRPLARTVAHATVCISFVLRDETLILQGTATPPRVWIEYLRPGTRPWLARVGEIARHMSLGHAAPGTWIVFVALALLAATVALVSRLVVRELS